MKHARFPDANVSVSEIERLLHHMPTVANYAQNDWAAEFAQSIERQSRRRGWQPTTKQLSMMRKLVSDLFAHGRDLGGEIDVIE